MLPFTVWYFLQSSIHTMQHGTATNTSIVDACSSMQHRLPMGPGRWEGLLSSRYPDQGHLAQHRIQQGRKLCTKRQYIDSQDMQPILIWDGE